MSTNESMFSEKDWPIILSFLGEDLILNQPLQRQKLADLDSRIEQNSIKRLPRHDHYDLTDTLLTLAYNIVARVASVPEKDFERYETVALFVPDFEDITMRLFEEKFPFAKLDYVSIFRFYHSAQDLVTAILNDEISGVVHISPQALGFIDSAKSILESNLASRDNLNCGCAIPPVLDFSITQVNRALYPIPHM